MRQSGILLAALFLAACQSTGDMIKSVGNSPDGTGICVVTNNLSGSTRVVGVKLDQEKGKRAGSMTVDADCRITVTTEGPEPTPPKEPKK